MIAWRLIVEASAITAVAVAVASAAVRWPAQLVIAAAAGSFAFILAWRAIANAGHWNDDFVRLVSAGDLGCLIAGAAAPALAAVLRRPGARRAGVPIAVGALIGFVINVVIL